MNMSQSSRESIIPWKPWLSGALELTGCVSILYCVWMKVPELSMGWSASFPRWVGRWGVGLVQGLIPGSVKDQSELTEIPRQPSIVVNGASGQVAVEQVPANIQRIQDVLMFWFGRHDGPDDSQKKLWMISAQSEERRIVVDREIVETFGNCVNDIATNTPWCSAVYGYQGKVATIIVLDQMSRHIHRYLTQQQPSHPLVIPSQKELDTVALRVAQDLYEDHAVEIKSGMIPLPMSVFSLLPFRHASRIDTVKYVQDQIELMNSLLDQYTNMLGRFRKATNRRMALLQDHERATGTLRSTLDLEYGDILECFPFSADMSTAPQHLVSRTIYQFLQANFPTFPSEPLAIVVSLSGGVDSMVIASVLARCSNVKTAAIHIDYGNRPESTAEADYVRWYCHELGIDFRCRKIDEVKRGVTARDDYERIAREIRYQAYRDYIVDFAAAGIALGHHKGDLRENVLSNSHRGCGPLDLSGMTATSQNDGVTLLRPLLLLEKKAVFDYAHTYGVPYFKDTTPSWSTRGKLRNKLLPLLEEIYGEGSMNNLSSLAVESDECRSLFRKAMLQPFLDSASILPVGIQFATKPWKNLGLFFWKFALRELLHSVGLGMFSDKSVAAFKERIETDTLREGWLQCRKDCATYLEENGTVSVFFPRFFPVRTAESFNVGDATLQCGESTVVGPWIVSTELVSTESGSKEASTLLDKKAYSSLNELLRGNLEYYVLSPVLNEEVAHLTFQTFTKATRPKAWKGLHVKTQAVLPLVGNGDAAAAVLRDHDHQAMIVRVKLSVESNGAHTSDASD